MIRPKRKSKADALPLAKTRSRPLVKRERREAWPPHLEFVARFRCVACRAHPVTIHHLRLRGSGAAGGLRSSDRYAIALCQTCHQGQGGIHHVGAEARWWAARGLDPLALCRELVRRSVAAGCAPPEWLAESIG